MTSVKSYAFAVLSLTALVSGLPQENPTLLMEFQSAAKDCAEKFSISDFKEALHEPKPENGCFFDCIRNKVTEPIKNSGSPLVAVLSKCEASIPTTADPCQDAYHLKVCMAKENPHFLHAHH